MINKLTKEQEALLPTYRDAGIEIGLRCNPYVDMDQVKELVIKHRELCGINDKVEYFKVYDSPMEAKREIPGLNNSNAFYGQQDINWLQYYKYMRDELNVTGLEKIQYLLELAELVGWFWVSSNAIVVTRQPKALRFDDSYPIKKLSSLDEPAIEYVNGEGIYLYDGKKLTETEIQLVKGVADVGSILFTKDQKLRNALALKYRERLGKLSLGES